MGRANRLGNAGSPFFLSLILLSYVPTACCACLSCDPGTYALKACVLSKDNDCEVCDNCFAGTYRTQSCTITSNTRCTNCPNNSYSPDLASSINSCYCVAGFYGSPLTSCLQCPENSKSVANSDTRDDCKCNMGYYGTIGAAAGVGACTACPAGKYGNGADGSRTSEDAGCASCVEGKYGSGTAKTSEASACVSCSGSSYTSQQAQTACLDCPWGKYSPSRSSACANCTTALAVNQYFSSNGGDQRNQLRSGHLHQRKGQPILRSELPSLLDLPSAKLLQRPEPPVLCGAPCTERALPCCHLQQHPCHRLLLVQGRGAHSRQLRGLHLQQFQAEQ